ncbi:hypothetical protein D3Z52_25285, partial [Clostridiaceae bacterium]|nr:hypothetical protein [Clostridiaceae bacterium]
PDYGKWGSMHQRFIRWRKKGIWENLLETLIDEPDYEWLMIDASHIKVHPHAAGQREEIRRCRKQKGAQYQNTSGRGCEWYASPNRCYRRYQSGL